MKSRLTPFLVSALATTIPLQAADNPLKQTLTDLNAYYADHWIYNDLDAAKAEARRSGKPIFVTFRCVPCKSCKSFDAEVANGSEVIKKLAQEKFVSLRQVEMKGVDLNLFQFDHDLNWAAMFINADGVIYGRYGTQSAAGPDAFNSIESLEKAMRRVLALHQDYPANKASLAGKRGANRPYSTALEMPGMENKDKLRGPTQRSNCIHCHMIHDAQNLEAWRKGTYNEELLWRYPYPDNLGISIDPDDGRVIESVQPNSPAAKAGLKRGDAIRSVNGQPIVSIADFQWVLHNLPNTATDITLVALPRLGGNPVEYRLRAQAGWKKTDISWRGSLWGMPPRLRIWFPSMTPAELKKAGLPEDLRASQARWINNKFEAGRAAQKAGLRLNDVIVELDGKPVPEDSQHFSLYVKLNFKPGETLPLTVLRDGRRIQLKLPLFE